jgi:3-dehydroquinate synthetase
MATDMSHRLGWIDDSIRKRVVDILKQAKLPIAPPETMTVEKFKNIMAVSTLRLPAAFLSSTDSVFCNCTN